METHTFLFSPSEHLLLLIHSKPCTCLLWPYISSVRPLLPLRFGFECGSKCVLRRLTKSYRNNQQEFIIPMFLNCSTCFGRHTTHYQKLKNCDCSLWFYVRLWLPVRPRPAAQLNNHAPTVKPYTATAVVHLLMMGVRTP
jgi:hypothetical protein